MPRISAAALGVVPVVELEFPPPAHLSEAEKVVFGMLSAPLITGISARRIASYWRCTASKLSPPAT